MLKQHQRIKIFFLLAGDFILFYAALAATLFFRYRDYLGSEKEIIFQRHYLPFTLTFAVWAVVFGAFGLYDIRFLKNSRIFLYRLVRAMAVNIIATITIFYLVPIFEIEPRRNLLLIGTTATILIFAWRHLFNLVAVHASASRVLFFGVSKETVEFVDYLRKNPQLGPRPVGFITPEEEEHQETLPLPNYVLKNHNLEKIIRDTQATLVVVSSDIKENKLFVKMLFQVIPLGVGTAEFSSFYESLTGKISLSLIGEIWFLENLIGIKKRFYEFFKRLTDILVAFISGTLSTLLFPFIAAAIKLDSAGPIFYKQSRVGRNGKEFRLIKYRTMIKDADKLSGMKEHEDDSRHTRVGKFLRKNYLDELPQIINILKGEMSFVGPRPERPEYVAQLKQKIPFYEMRLLVAPGITGWAQIHMENDASVEDAPEKMQYDLYYIKNKTFLLDLLIALKTILIILQRQGR